MADYNTGIRLTGDASSLVDAQKQAAQGQKALADEFKKGGDAVKQNAAEAARFVDQLKDQAAELGKTKRQVEEYRASQLSLTDAQKASVKTSLDQIEAHEQSAKSLDKVKGGLLAAAAAVATYVAAKAEMVRSAIDEMAELDRLRQQIGMSTESLSVYRYQASLAGVSNEEFSMGMRNLARNVAEARGGVGNGAQIFALLGKEVEGAVKSGASMEQLLPLIAEQFSRSGDGANKTALAVELFGRAGERLIPFLNQGKAGIAALRAEAERLGVVIGGDTARDAEALENDVRRLEAATTSWKYALAKDLLPALTDITNEMIRGHREGGLLLGVYEGLKKSAQYIAGVGSEKQELEGTLTLLRERYDLMQHLNANAARGERNEGQRMALQADINRLEQERNRLVDVLAINNPTAGGDVPRAAAAAKGQMGARAGAGTETDYDKLIRQIRERTAVTEAEMASTTKLTDADRAALQIMVALQSGTLKLTDTQKRALAAEVERMVVSGQAAQSYQHMLDQIREGDKAYADRLDSQRKAIATTAQEIDRMREQNQAIGLTTAELGRLKIARAEEAVVKAQAAEADYAASHNSYLDDPEHDPELQLLKAKTAQTEQLLGLTRQQANFEVWDATRTKNAEEAKAIRDDLNRAVTDGLMRGFENGKGFAENFRDALVNAFKTAVLRPVISAIIDPMTAPYASMIAAAGRGVQGWFAPTPDASSLTGAYGGMDSSAVANFDYASVLHSGGIAGVDGARRYVHPAYFENAPRFHSGGEVPAILQAGEEVLTRSDPRHSANGGGAPASIRVEIVNNGTPQEIQSVTPSADGGGMVLQLVMRDIANNGQAAQLIQHTYGLNRAAGAPR